MLLRRLALFDPSSDLYTQPVECQMAFTNNLRDKVRGERSDLENRSPIVIIATSEFISLKRVKHMLCFDVQKSNPAHFGRP